MSGIPERALTAGIPNGVTARREAIRAKYEEAADRRDATRQEFQMAQREYELLGDSLDSVDYVINLYASETGAPI